MSFTLRLFTLAIALCYPLSSLHAATLFSADFDASTPVSGTLTDNATEANLEAGTAIGGWDTNGTDGLAGHIVSDGSGNNGFAFDPTGGSHEAIARLISPHDFDNTGTIEFDIFATRQGSGRFVVIQLRREDNAIPFNFRFNLTNSKSFQFVGTGGATTTVASVPAGETGAGFKNPAVDNYLSDFVMINVLMEFTGAGDTVLDSGGILMSVDWNGDKDFSDTNDVSQVVVNARNAGIEEFEKIKFDIGGSSGNRGAWIDNLIVTSVPEPGTLVLLVMGTLGCCARRRTRVA